MAALLYYLLLKPLSLLPTRVLYGLSDGLYVLVYRVFGYRKRVVLTNLRNSFPDKSEAEIRAIAGTFYRQLCDWVVESIRNFSIPLDEAMARFRVVNPELLDPYFEQGRHVALLTNHYANWELLPLGGDPYIQHHAIGIYAPLNNAFFDRKIIESRTRHGAGVHSKHDVRAMLERGFDVPVILCFIADQAPRRATGDHLWTTFLHQDTPVMRGAEKIATEHDWPVVYGRTTRVKRGYYRFELQLLTDRPRELPPYAITQRYSDLLEAQIREAPAYWLWSHKRWKRRRPADANPASSA